MDAVGFLDTLCQGNSLTKLRLVAVTLIVFPPKDHPNNTRSITNPVASNQYVLVSSLSSARGKLVLILY